MDRITATAPNKTADTEELLFVDVYPRQLVNRRALALLFCTARLALAGVLVWAAVHYFQNGQIPAILDANGRWAWFGAGVFALMLLNETGAALTAFSDAWGCLRMTLWQARTAKALPAGERLRLITAAELRRVRNTWPPTPADVADQR